MSQNAEREKVKRIIRLLIERTEANGFCEAEAITAAEKVGDLMTQYALTMSDIEIKQEKCISLKFASGSKNRRPVDDILMNIASFCDCRVYTTRAEWRGQRQIVFFGFEPDAEMAKYLYLSINTAITTETEAFKATPEFKNDEGIWTRAVTGSGHNRAVGKINAFSFQKGMVSRIAARLREIKAASVKEMKEKEEALKAADVAKQPVSLSGVATSSGTSLMVVKIDHVAEEFENLSKEIKLRSHRAVTRRPAAGKAYGAGRAAGEKVNLSRPITGGATLSLPR